MIIYSKVSTYTSVYNKELKELSKQLNIDSGKSINLSSHMARHTFAYISLLTGQSIYYISKALNHKSIKTTEIYLRGFNNRNLDDKFYKEELSATEKNAINNKLLELLSSEDYDKKKKILDLFNL
jgi:integrase